MTASHHSGRHRQSRLRDHLGRRVTAVSIVGAAGAAGWLFTAQAAQPQPAPAPSAPQSASAPAHQEIQLTGQVIAASSNSLTTSTPDGQTTTFRITPQTTQIGAPGTGTPNAIALKRNVVVLGIVHDGVPVATAIADATVGPDGPPMDYGLPT